MNYYPFHIGDFRSGTVNMTRHARWIYRDMLDVYYDSEKPLPLDIDVLCHEIGVESVEDRAVVERLLRFKFTKTESGYTNDVCEKVISEYHTKAEIAKANGRLGGRPPKANGNQNKPSGFPSGFYPVADCIQIESVSEANQEPITNNQKQIDIKPLSIASTDVIEIFDHWRLVMSSPKSKLDDKRRSLITKALRLGYTADQLKSAIDGCARTPHNMGINDRNTKYNSLGLILRDADNIDRFMGAPTRSNHETNKPVHFQSAADRKHAAILETTDYERAINF